MIGSLLDNLRSSLLRFKTDKEYNELIRTSFLALLVRMIGVSTGFFVTLLTSRFFGADALGLVSICIAILSFASVFGKLGLDVALMKYVAEFAGKNDFASIKSVYISAMKIILPVSFLISSVLFFLSGYFATNILHKPYLEELLKVNAWLTLPLVLILVNSECIRGLKKIRSYTFFQTVSVSLMALVLLIIMSFFYSAREIPTYIQFLSIAFTGLLSLMMWFYYSKFFKEKSANEFPVSTLMRTSSSMFFTTLMQLIMSWAGTLILAAYNSEADVGVYNALVRISVFTNITILAINSLAMPRFAEAFALGKLDVLKKLSKEVSRLIFITSIPAFILLTIFPEWILSIFGKEFPGNETALYVLLAGQFIVAITGLPSQILNMTGRQHILRNIAFFSAIVNVVACVILVPLYGIMGTCIAQFAGIFAWNLLSILSVKNHFGFFTFFNPFAKNN
ncbi:MAG: flippase [Bacteroidetes bacterium]|nr:flippase [Bacteroidota bacterium]